MKALREGLKIGIFLVFLVTCRRFFRDLRKNKLRTLLLQILHSIPIFCTNVVIGVTEAASRGML